MKWEKVKLKTKMKTKETPEGKKSPGRKGGIMGPGKRWGHTCNSVKNGRFLYVFGGYGKDNCQTNDVHVFDSGKQTWSKPMVKGTPPSPRDSHSCTTVGTNLFVFGGTDGKNPLRDLHMLDTTTNTWVQPNVSGEGPAAREGHSAALIDHRLFIFGGCGKAQDESEEIYYNDLYILDTVNLIWTRAATSGTPPSPRDSHTCSSWKNKIIVLGGEDASDSYLSDVYVLDADTLVWKELNTTGQILAPRAGHATVSLGKHLFVFGGFTDDRNLFDDLHMLNIETGVWTKVATTGQGPSARFSIAGDCLDFKRGILIFIGGCNENLEALDDMYYLDTEMKMENGQDEQKPEKFSLRKELKRKRQEHHVSSNDPEKERDTPKLDVKPRNILSTTPPTNIPAGIIQDKPSVYTFKPVEEKIFEAKITDVFHYGYTIESHIEGKPLRGLLFSYKPGFAHAVHAYLTRKKLASEASAGTLDAATLFVMLGPGNDAPHFMMEIIQNDSSNFILLLDLLPRKDLVFNPDYLKTFYEDTELENYRQLVEKAPQSQFYVPSSLYVRSAVSPTALLFKFRDLSSPHDLHSLVEELIHPTANKVFRTWVDAFDGCHGRPEVEEEEKMMILARDEQIRSIGIEKDLSYLPKLFGQEIADRVIAAIRKGQ